MSNESIIQISAETSGVERGVRQAERSLNNLANAAQRTGNQASGSLNRVGDAATRRGLRQRGLAAASDGAAVTQKSHRRLSFKPSHHSGFNAGSDTGNKRSDRPEESLTNKLAP